MLDEMLTESNEKVRCGAATTMRYDHSVVQVTCVVELHVPDEVLEERICGR